MLTMDVAGVAEHPLHVGNARFLSSGVEAVKQDRNKGRFCRGTENAFWTLVSSGRFGFAPL